MISAFQGASAGGKIAAGVVGALVVGTAAGGIAMATSGDGDRATVVRVIDGDTLVASVGGTETTVRLLNIDTPETKDPNAPVECLGPEASAYLEDRLPAGSTVTLEYDVERTDRYGRTLAGVFESGTLVNADIAAAGLGVAVLYQPNSRFHDEVLSAQARAKSAGAGFYDPAVECTLPAAVGTAARSLEELAAVAPTDVAGAAEGVAAAAAALAAAKSLHGAVKGAALSGGTVFRAAYGPADLASQSAVLTTAIAAGTAEHRRLAKAESSLKAEAAQRKAAAKKAAAERAAAQKAAAARAAAEKAAAAQRAAAARAAAEKAAAIRAANQRAAAEQAAAARAAQQAAAAREAARPRQAPPKKPSPPAASNPYPGYNGPRCYAPGGKSWKPCP
ncbi:thermonuclease family protein [Arthrobacter halodurans]